MGKVQVGKETSTPIDVHYQDRGSGRPVLLIRGSRLPRFLGHDPSCRRLAVVLEGAA